MARRKRQANTFNLSFLDIMSCGFGAVVLVFLIIDHSIEIQIQSVNAEVLSEVDLLEEDIREGEEGLVRLRNAISSTDLNIVEAQGRARVVTEELDRLEALIASLEESDVSETTDLEALKAEINSLEERIQQLREAAEAEGGRSAREFQGEGNRQYVTGLKLGGRRILIFLDASASMLDKVPANIAQFKVRPESVRRQAPKWRQALGTVEWIVSQLPTSSSYQIIYFNTDAQFTQETNQGSWIPVSNTTKLNEDVTSLKRVTPDGGTSLFRAFKKLEELKEPPDNIFLITDGLPTQGESPPTSPTVSSAERIRHLRQAASLLPRKVPLNIILLPMRGDPAAASELWRLTIDTKGSLVAPSKDWP